MERLKIKVYVPKHLAIAAGVPEYGGAEYFPTAEELQSLTPGERNHLVEYEDRPGQFELLHLTAATLDFGTIRESLRASLAARAEQQAEHGAKVQAEITDYNELLRRNQWFAPGLPLREIKHEGIWDWGPNHSKNNADAQQLWSEIKKAKAAERAKRILDADAALNYERDGDSPAEPIRLVLSAACSGLGWESAQSENCDPVPHRALELRDRIVNDAKAERAERAAANEHAEHSLLIKHGSRDQVERYEAGVLPEEEFSGIVKRVLFERFADLPLYQSLAETDVDHTDDCMHPEPKFTSRDFDGPFDADEWGKLKSIKALLTDDDRCAVRKHLGWCTYCDTDKIERLGVRVTIEFAGEDYTREFAL